MDDIQLMLNINFTLDLDASGSMVHNLLHHNLAGLEEAFFPPVDSTALAEFLLKTRIPITAGESFGNLLDVERMLDAQVVDVAQPDPIKMGGSAVAKGLQMAQARWGRVDPSPWHSPWLMAALHMTADMEQNCFAE